MATQAVEIEFAGLRHRTPPFASVFLNVVLRNDAADYRWFLLPLFLHSETASEPLSTGAVEVFAARGNGRVLICRFLGSGPFQALRLPPKAEVRIRRMTFSWFGDLPRRPVSARVIVASGLAIGHQTALEWLPVDPTCDVKADVTEEPGEIVASRDAADHKEVTATPNVVDSFEISVEISGG